jgi:FlaA1/EpsC-like NDP-sugar epimerase
MGSARRGEIYVPDVPSARIVDVAAALIGERPVDVVFTSIRPGEKLHEILVSGEEAIRTSRRGSSYVIEPLLPELQDEAPEPALDQALSSGANPISRDEVVALVARHGISVDSEDDARALVR